MDFAKLPSLATVLHTLWVFFVIVIGFEVLRRLVGDALYTAVVRFFRRLKRQRASVLTKDIIEHRLEVRDEIADRLGKGEYKDGIEILLTDALRGGRTYDENKRFLKMKNKYHYQKVHITDYYDKLCRVGLGMPTKVHYSRLRRKWVKSKDGKTGVTAIYMGELNYDHVVKIDWEAGKSDNVPTLYYNYPFFSTFEREYFAIYKGGLHYDELRYKGDGNGS
jgi:hypothetical protein